jgi:hypothetical protein
MYNILRYKTDTLAEVMGSSSPTIMFRRNFVGPRIASLNALIQRMAFVQLTQGSDMFSRWNLNENGKFSMDSMYKALI